MNRRIRDYGIFPGAMQPGSYNKITDVPGVLVGHTTIDNEENKTGVTVILPTPENPFLHKSVAACYVQNGFGKTCGLPQIEELGCLETPIALTNTLNVGLVSDALVELSVRRCAADGVTLRSVNPVVGECNDGGINRITHRAVGLAHVLAAAESACADFAEGAVGAGMGTVCYGFKGGIGSASRVVPIDGREYLLGVLVQSNFGATSRLLLNGFPAGKVILKATDTFRRAPAAAIASAAAAGTVSPKAAAPDSRAGERNGQTESAAASPAENDQGSIMMIIATNLPVSDRQLKRIIRRAGNGLAMTGSYTGHGSGEIMIGFTTANPVPHQDGTIIRTQEILSESLLDPAFRAVGEATEEAVLNSLVAADTTVGLNGKTYYSLAEFAPLWADACTLR